MSRPAIIPHGVPEWQADESASECQLCDTKFTVFNRRHHCRKCGRLVCGSCSTGKTTYLPSTYVVSPPSQIFLESPHVPHRTCDECVQELEMIRAALRTRTRRSRTSRSRTDSRSESSQGPSNRRSGDSEYPYSSEDGYNKRDDEHQLLIQSVPIDVADEEGLCPICGSNISGLEVLEKEEHISDCLHNAEFSGSPEHRRNNRMIIYQLPEKESSSLGECLICFEDYRPGEIVGRLECLCIYHERCILDWFARKGAGECPVHSVHA